MFQIIAVPFDAFQALPSAQHRWLLTCLARYTDPAGKAFPTMRQLAVDARLSLSTVCRRLAEMADLAVFQRTRNGVGRYICPRRGLPPALAKARRRPCFRTEKPCFTG